MIGPFKIRPVSRTMVRVRFSESVRDNPAFLNPDIYRFNPGTLQVIGVWFRDSQTVDLLTTEQNADQPYSLIVDPGNG